MRSIQRTAVLAVLIFYFVSLSFGQTTEFTYQGNLRDGTNPANGNYDFEFALYDALAGGTLITTPLARNTVNVSNGSFAVKLDFGNQFPGANRFLEIRVRLSGQPGMTVLAPRQQVNSGPYAVKSISADSALNAQNAVNATNATNATNAANASNATTAATATNALSLGGVVAGQYVLTGDARLSDARAPTAGSDNYIQNRFATAESANFNISGIGTADIFNAATEYRLGFQKILSGGGNSNLFVGRNAGQNNTLGSNNVFVGSAAGSLNTEGSENSFFGASAGARNSTGNRNTYYGYYVGHENTTGTHNAFFGWNTGNGNTGSYNSFFGPDAGGSNTLGSNNVFVGYNAGAGYTIENNNTFIGTQSGGPSGISNATALGYRARVSQSNSLVLGGMAANGGFDTNVGIGTTAPSERLHVVGNAVFTGNIGIGTLSTGIRLHVVGLISGTATPSNHIALIENSSTGTSPDVLALKIGRATDPDDANNFITFFKGDNTSAGSIQGNAAGGVMLGGPGSDYAEWLPRLDRNEKIEPGDIVGIFNGRISKTTAGASQVMAVSTGAIVAGNDPGEKRRETHSLIAFIGQAMVKVIGPVIAGDFILPSGLEDGSGIAVSPENITAAQFGQALGQAWEASDETSLRYVRVAVGLIRSDPTVHRLFEKTRTQQTEIRSLQRQINELKKLICPAITQAEACKEQ